MKTKIYLKSFGKRMVTKSNKKLFAHAHKHSHHHPHGENSG